jgi:hypothetical protein
MVHEPWRREYFNMGKNEVDFPEQVPRLLPNKGTKRGTVQDVSEGGRDP